jgi:hemin uptake protein HemP
MSTLTRSRSKDVAAATPVATRATTGQQESGDASSERTLSSDHLLQGRSHIFIAHNGERYQLRATRLGKLILTK